MTIKDLKCEDSGLDLTTTRPDNREAHCELASAGWLRQEMPAPALVDMSSLWAPASSQCSEREHHEFFFSILGTHLAQ